MRERVNTGSGSRPWHRRAIYFSLIVLFVLQTFLTWTSATTVPEGAGTLNAEAIRGRTYFNEFNCTACHQFYGLGGHLGPDLTNVTIAEGKGSAYAKGIILHGTASMPAPGVDLEKADAIVAYLEAMAASGPYPIRSFDPTWIGTYKQMHADAQ